MKRLMILTALMLGVAQPALAAQLASVVSPDQHLKIVIENDNDGRMQYSLIRDGRMIIAPSRLGFILSDQQALMRGFTFEGS